MNKKVAIIIVAVLVVVGVGVFATRGTTDNQVSQIGGNSAEVPLGEAGEGVGELVSGNIKDLIMRGASLRCDFKHVDDRGGSTAGTVFTSGEQMRGDFEYNEAGGAVTKSSMIRNEEFTYIWGSGEESGIKIRTPNEDVDATLPVQDVVGSTQFDPSTENVDYNCVPWSVQTSTFEPPSDVPFTDLSATFEQMQIPNNILPQ